MIWATRAFLGEAETASAACEGADVAFEGRLSTEAGAPRPGLMA
ncbi:MAG: hypothetical protein AAGA48_33730 [Myxococcota bacterium]